MTDATSVETVKAELGLDIMQLLHFSSRQHELELKHKHCSAMALCYNTKNAKQMGKKWKTQLTVPVLVAHSLAQSPVIPATARVLNTGFSDMV